MIFSAIRTAGSGMGVYRTWLDAVAGNIANINTAGPTDAAAFQARYVVAESVGYGEPGGDGGARVAGIALGDPAGRLVYQPGHPLADEDGMVRYPDVDLGDQMTQLLVAQRAYQANLAVVQRARAEVVQRRMAAVEQRIELSLRGARRALVIASRLTTRPPHPARFVDTRA